jgi:hypothetical protein
LRQLPPGSKSQAKARQKPDKSQAKARQKPSSVMLSVGIVEKFSIENILILYVGHLFFGW